MITIPNGSIYQQILDGYLGTSFATAASGFGKKQDALWAAFLAENHLSPTDTKVVNADPAILTKFVQFIQGTAESLQSSGVSPDESTKRQVVFACYALLVKMMETLQQNVGVTGDNIAFLGKYQQQYTNLMTKLSQNFYIGGSPDFAVPNLNDFSKWTLGYARITMQDYLETIMVGNNSTAPNGTSFSPLTLSDGSNVLTFSSTGPGNVSFSINVPFPPISEISTVTFDPNTGNIATFTIPNTQVSVTVQLDTLNQVIFIQSTDPPNANVTINSFSTDQTTQETTISYFFTPPSTGASSQAVTFNPSDLFGTNLQIVENAFKDFLNTPVPGTSNTVFNYTTNMTHPWSGNYNAVFTATTDSSAHAFQQAAAQRRANKNSLLQQYVIDAQTKQKIISNQSDAQSSNLQQAQSGMGQGASVLNTAIGQLSTMITSIFQVSG